MNKIKTYPLTFIDIKLEKIRVEAEKQGMNIKEFIHAAIDEKILNKEE